MILYFTPYIFWFFNCFGTAYLLIRISEVARASSSTRIAFAYLYLRAFWRAYKKGVCALARLF